MRSKFLVLSSLFLLLASCTPTYIVTFSGSTGGSVSNMGGEYDEGTTVSVSAQPETGYEFIGWSDGSSQNPRTISVSQNLNLTALFSKQQFSVSVNTEGEGTVATSGATGQGSFEYGSSARFEAVPAAGWVFDSWSGNASGTSNPLNISVDGPLTITATFKRQKFDLSVTVQGEGTVTEQVIVQPGQYDYESVVKLTASPAEGWEFVNWSGDIGSTENPVTVTVNTAKNITANFNELEVVSMEILNPIDTLVISRKHKFQVEGTYSNGEKVDLTNLVELEPVSDTVNALGGNEFTVIKSGNTSISIRYDGLELTYTFFAQYFEEIQPHPYLTSPAENSVITVPVVIITYLPLTEGLFINQDTYPIRDYGNQIYNDLSIREVQNWVLANDIKTKYSVEEGSKFRGYNNPQANPYVGIKVVKQFNFYEIPKKPNPYQTVLEDGEEGWYPDYEAIFELIDMKSLVNESGVKEIWFNSKSLGIPESNMSSPVTGDISNSYKEEDLPIYNKTYIVYGNFIHLWYAENIHNRGHQIEAQLTYIDRKTNGNDKFFWQTFVGYPQGDPQPYHKGGRVGSTHYTPNSTRDYDYNNSDPILSDIQDWRPDNQGEKTLVNNQTWKFPRYLPVSLPEFDKMSKYKDLTRFNDVGGDDQGGWLIYWNQSIPGYQNNIPYEKDGVEYTLTNWWDLIYNWDEAVTQGKTLWE